MSNTETGGAYSSGTAKITGGNPNETMADKAARYRAETLHLVAGMMDVMDRAKADGINITYSVNFNPAIGKHMIVALSLTKEL